MSRHLILTGTLVIFCSACAPVPVKLSGDLDVNVIKPETTIGFEKSVTHTKIERVVRHLDKCPKLDASLVNTEVSDGSKICHYIAEQEE